MYPTIPRDRPPVRPVATHDAVLVVPGIMGTELYEAATGRMLWGMAKVAEYAARWDLDKGMDALALTEDERAGRLGRVVPGRLLRTPAWMPLTDGFEPYTPLVKSLRKVAAHRDAVAEFGYDWRLPVEHNARLLADAVDRHLTAWRAHPACVAARDRAPDQRPARIVLVAHSMGGLLTAALALIPGAVDEVRAVLTVGTPFHGAVKATEILNSGRGMLGLPAKNLSRLARTLPGVHDLLPSYRCLDTGDDVVALTPSDVESIGGDHELARDAFELHARLDKATLPGHRIVEGTAQPTTQSLRIRDGVVEARHVGYDRHDDGELLRDGIGRLVEFDHGGDGTVYRYSTTHGDVDTYSVAQQHAALAVTGSVVDFAQGLLTGGRRGARLGGTDVGLDLPDRVPVGTEFEVVVRTEQDPGRVSCLVEDAGAEMLQDPVRRPVLMPVPGRDGVLGARVRLDAPGLYRVKVGGGGDPVTRLVMVA
ncbi:esterase/lipase family protein [Streptomyces sp. NPDC058755]|uniref:esterase/lipase family protein n=1 Tax=Streptomyces sp. NPDC058755 TaxID=3346624 RepID=UPI0036C19399